MDASLNEFLPEGIITSGIGVLQGRSRISFDSSQSHKR
jgi:hypothetical protein